MSYQELRSGHKLPRSFILPGQPTTYARPHKFNIKHSRIEVELDFEKKSIDGKVLHEIEPVGEEIKSVELDCCDLEIKSVKLNGKQIANFVTKSASIWIPMGFDLQPGNKVQLEICYSGTPKKGLYFRGPDKDNPDRKLHAFTQGESEDTKFWLPCYDYPNMRTTTETTVIVPANMVVVSNGSLVAEPLEKSGKKSWHFVQQIAHPSYLTSIVAGVFKDVKETHRGVLLEYVYPEGKDEEAKRSFGNTSRMIDLFSKLTGEMYPYPKYSQATVSDFMFGGMENITATTLTERTLHDARSHLDFTSDYLVAHELAHQWFGDLQTCKDWSHTWLNEGFATYFAALWLEHDKGADEFQYYMYLPTMDQLVEELSRYHRPIVSKRYWDPDELFDYHTYQKGAWVLHGVRGLLGDELFFKGIKNYVGKHKQTCVETSDFRKTLEETSGLDLEYFFDEWLYSPGFPEYNVAYSWNEDQKLVELVIEQANAGTDGTPVFTSPIEIRFSFKDGTKISKNTRLKEKKETLFFQFEEAPVNINLDPKNWVLKKLNFAKPKEMHLFQLRNDENAMERIRAAGELSAFPTDDTVQDLSNVIDTDKSWTVQLEAAKALGKMGTKKALDALLQRVAHKDHKTRRGVAFGLRGFANLDTSERDVAIDALIKILMSDESYYARGYAAWSLGFYKGSDKAFEAIKTALTQESINDIVRYRSFQGFWQMNDPKAIPLAIDYLEHGKWHQGRMLAAYCLGNIGKGDSRVTGALLASEMIPNVHVRDEAAAAVGELGDTSAISSLELWLAREPEGRTRRRLRESIHLLRERVLEAEKLSKLDADVEKLSATSKKTVVKLNALEERLGGFSD